MGSSGIRRNDVWKVALVAQEGAVAAAVFFGENLAEHPFVQAHPRLKARAEKLANLLADFYQLVGQMCYKIRER